MICGFDPMPLEGKLKTFTKEYFTKALQDKARSAERGEFGGEFTVDFIFCLLSDEERQYLKQFYNVTVTSMKEDEMIYGKR